MAFRAGMETEPVGIVVGDHLAIRYVDDADYNPDDGPLLIILPRARIYQG
jgi:hypothetical protein